MILDRKELKKENRKVTIVGDSIEEPVVPPAPIEPEDYTDGTGAIVDLPEGLIPVIYSDNNWKVVDTSTKWYDYNNQEWANAVILNAGVTKNIGDTVEATLMLCLLQGCLVFLDFLVVLVVQVHFGLL